MNPTLLETPKEASSTDVTQGNNEEAIGGKKVPATEGHEEPGQRPQRRDKAVERLFKMQTKFMGEQGATNKLLLESIQKLTSQSSAVKKPEFKDFDKPEEFADAIEKWSAGEVIRKASEPKQPVSGKESTPANGETVELSDEQRSQHLSQKFGLDEEVSEQFIEAQNDASERIPDFEEVVSDPKIPSSRTLSRLIIELGDADLYYHLSLRANRLKTLELSKLKRSGDVLEKLKEIQAEIAEQDPETPRAREKDPEAPINPVGSSRVKTKKSPAQESQEEYFERRQAEINKSKRLV
jgi:hypothetical protein